MNDQNNAINEILVELFNDLLLIEQKSMEAEINDITINEIHTIEAVGVDEEKTMTEVAAKLKITVGTLTTCINKLVKKGYVERRRTEEDRRMVLLRLTEKGVHIFRSHKAFHTMMVKNTVRGLTSEEEEILKRALSKLNAFFKKEISDL